MPVDLDTLRRARTLQRLQENVRQACLAGTPHERQQLHDIAHQVATGDIDPATAHQQVTDLRADQRHRLATAA